jgi:hypothetical protein
MEGGGGKGGKINQGERGAEVMSRRTCVNRSGSLAGRVAESNRIFCHTTWIRRLRTLTPLYFSAVQLPPSVFLLLFPVNWVSSYLDVTPLHYVSSLPSPSLDSCTHLN